MTKGESERGGKGPEVEVERGMLNKTTSEAGPELGCTAAVDDRSVTERRVGSVCV